MRITVAELQLTRP